MNTAPSRPAAPDESTDAFDLILAILQRWKWILGVGVLCALLAYGIGLRSPLWYVSTTVIDPLPPHPVDGLDYGTLEARRQFGAKVPGWLNSPATLAAAAQQAEKDGARLSSDGIRVRIGKQDGMVTVTVEANRPEAAQSISQALLRMAVEESRPNDEDRAQLELELARFDEQLAALNSALTGLRHRLARSPHAMSPDNAHHLVSMSSTLRLTDRQRQATRARLEGLTEEYVTQGPSLPSSPSNMRPRTRAVWGLLGGLFAMTTLIGMQWTFAGAGPSAVQRARFRSLFRTRAASKP